MQKERPLLVKSKTKDTYIITLYKPSNYVLGGMYSEEYAWLMSIKVWPGDTWDKGINGKKSW